MHHNLAEFSFRQSPPEYRRNIPADFQKCWADLQADVSYSVKSNLSLESALVRADPVDFSKADSPGSA